MKMTPQKKELLVKEGPEIRSDSLSEAAVKQLIGSAKKRGYVTFDQLNAVLPAKKANSERIQDILSIFEEMGVDLVEGDETKPDET